LREPVLVRLEAEILLALEALQVEERQRLTLQRAQTVEVVALTQLEARPPADMESMEAVAEGIPTTPESLLVLPEVFHSMGPVAVEVGEESRPTTRQKMVEPGVQRVLVRSRI
jgi:hypothetical protein